MDRKIDEKKVSLEEAREQVRKVCERLALLHLSFSKVIISELGKVKGKKLILKAIKNYGISIGEEIRDYILKEGLNDNPKNYKNDRDLPLYGMHDRKEKLSINGEERSRIYGCVMGKVWKELGEDEIGRYYCYVDPAKYMAFNPNYKLIHTKSIPNGDGYCEFKIESTTKKEREDFFKKDSDWSYIDKY
jgi:hypothetical protein